MEYIKLQVDLKKCEETGKMLYTLSRADGGCLDSDGAISYGYSTQDTAINGLQDVSWRLNGAFFNALRNKTAEVSHGN